MSNLTQKELDRAQEIGGKFLAWTPETGPCPISINDPVWFKRVCGLFETQARLETLLAAARQRIAELEEAGRWIPVGAEPIIPDGEDVIRLLIVWYYEGDRTRHPQIGIGEKWRDENTIITLDGDFDKVVTHWRPLPPPPQEEK